MLKYEKSIVKFNNKAVVFPIVTLDFHPLKLVCKEADFKIKKGKYDIVIDEIFEVKNCKCRNYKGSIICTKDY